MERAWPQYDDDRSNDPVSMAPASQSDLQQDTGLRIHRTKSWIPILRWSRNIVRLFRSWIASRWIPDKYNFDGDVFLDFPMTEIDLQTAANELDEQLLQFPVRLTTN